jgi:hypothetical protein
MYLTRGPSGPDPRPCGPRGWPVGRPRFEAVRLEPWLPRVYMRKRIPSRWRPLHPIGRPRVLVARPHLSPNRPLQVGGGLIHLYKYLLTVKVDTPHSTCISPLVKENTLPIGSQESSQVFARAPEVVLEIGEILYLYLSL